MMTTPLPRTADGLAALFADARFPARYRAILQQFVSAYTKALADARFATAEIDGLLAGFVDRLAAQLASPFVFDPYHQQITEPFDYYRFGIEFLRPLVDKAASSVAGHDAIDRAAAEIARGDNVVFLANHQTEGDPQAIALLLEDTHPSIGREMVFVAGERVTTDPLAVPFSMGCNLLCVYSKRYIDHPPELKAAKQHHNRKTMERMTALLAEGGHAIYAAPSGGRDRPNADGLVEVAPFDPQSVEMYAVMAARAGRPCHFYPMALATYDFLPPPETVKVELGEPRVIRRTGIHLGVAAEVDMDAFSGDDLADKHERRRARAENVWRRVAEMYARFPVQGRRG